MTSSPSHKQLRNLGANYRVRPRKQSCPRKAIDWSKLNKIRKDVISKPKPKPITPHRFRAASPVDNPNAISLSERQRRANQAQHFKQQQQQLKLRQELKARLEAPREPNILIDIPKDHPVTEGSIALSHCGHVRFNPFGHSGQHKFIGLDGWDIFEQAPDDHDTYTCGSRYGGDECLSGGWWNRYGDQGEDSVNQPYHMVPVKIEDI